MKHNTVLLKDYYNLKGGTLSTYIADKPLDDDKAQWHRPAVIIVPGGGYRFCSKREQEVVAFEFIARGFNAFVLRYLCEPDGVSYPEQLLELAAAVDYVKRNATDYCINPDEVFAIGFSAGGHLVASLSTDMNIAKSLYDGSLDASLKGAGLIYPVISDEYGHIDSHKNLFKHCDNDRKNDYLPLTRMDKLVSPKSAPAFIFSTFEDKTVPPLNSLKYAEALGSSGVKYELHIYPSGGHGMSVATAEVNECVDGISRNRRWLDDCAAFFRELTVEKF